MQDITTEAATVKTAQLTPPPESALLESALFDAGTQSTLIGALITSALMVAGLILLRQLIIRTIRAKSEILNKDQRRMIVNTKNITWGLVFVGLLMIWAPQLHTFALSITAFTVAVVIATKEIILCLTGAIYRVSNTPFKVGDWITVEGTTGEVINTNALGFDIQVIDSKTGSYQFTGQTVTIPNSKFFTANIENANFIKVYVLQDIPLTVQYADLPPDTLMQKLRDIVETHYAPLRDDAAKFIRRVERKAGVDLPDAEPQFFLRTSDVGHNVFTVRQFVPTREAARIASAITVDFLKYVHAAKKRQKKAA